MTGFFKEQALAGLRVMEGKATAPGPYQCYWQALYRLYTQIKQSCESDRPVTFLLNDGSSPLENWPLAIYARTFDDPAEYLMLQLAVQAFSDGRMCVEVVEEVEGGRFTIAIYRIGEKPSESVSYYNW